MAAAKPTQLTIRMYQVGFGDCFLLSFKYARGEKHVLVDFGSTGKPQGAPDMKAVAEDIRERCGKKLHVVVATHRHRDHISGFATSGGPGKIIADCKPDVVLQPWTEHPKAAITATTAPATALAARAMVASLDQMQRVSAGVLQAAGRLPRLSRALGRQLAFIGEDNLANLSAVKNLQSMGKKRLYLHYGLSAGLASILPGVKVHVLGPPDLQQSSAIRRERSQDDAEFWHLQRMAVDRFRPEAGGRLFGRAPHYSGRVPAWARWIRTHLDSMRGDQLLEIVRALDEAMNNTSLILLFEAGGKRFLFPGDAQIENWSYALKEAPDKETVRKLLKRVDFYKVGHHGSLNATPKTLWGLFDKRAKTGAKKALRSMVSTMPGKHGSTDRSTEVPRRTLIDALASETELFSTEIPKKQKDEDGDGKPTKVHYFKGKQLFTDLEFAL